VTRSRGPCDRCWPGSRDGKVPETPTFARRLPTYATGNNANQVQGQNVKVTTPITADRDLKCIISTEREDLRTLKSARRWSIRYQLPRPAIGLLQAG